MNKFEHSILVYRSIHDIWKRRGRNKSQNWFFDRIYQICFCYMRKYIDKKHWRMLTVICYCGLILKYIWVVWAFVLQGNWSDLVSVPHVSFRSLKFPGEPHLLTSMTCLSSDNKHRSQAWRSFTHLYGKCVPFSL